MYHKLPSKVERNSKFQVRSKSTGLTGLILWEPFRSLHVKHWWFLNSQWKWWWHSLNQVGLNYSTMGAWSKSKMPGKVPFENIKVSYKSKYLHFQVFTHQTKNSKENVWIYTIFIFFTQLHATQFTSFKSGSQRNYQPHVILRFTLTLMAGLLLKHHKLSHCFTERTCLTP